MHWTCCLQIIPFNTLQDPPSTLGAKFHQLASFWAFFQKINFTIWPFLLSNISYIYIKYVFFYHNMFCMFYI